MAKTSIPLGLYVHIPWCERKCPYCDFNSHTSQSAVDQASYVNALLRDLDTDLRLHQATLQDRKVQTIFIGGGTPSLFEPEHINLLLEGINARLTLAHDTEITMEANPGSAEADRFIGFKQAGVNRLSIGVQSFHDHQLKNLGRIHNSQQAIQAAYMARDAGFKQLNLDLMFGLPEQNVEQALDDVKQAIQLTPQHLSCYQLTIEPNTLFHHQPPITPDDEALWEMQTSLQTLIAQADYQQYEVSAYAQKDSRCRHNLNYWQFGDYLGIGAGAHAKITDLDNTIHRFWKIKHPSIYQTRCDQGDDAAGQRTSVEPNQQAFEFMLNALRLSNGFDSNLFAQRTSLELADIQSTLNKHQDFGLLLFTNERIQPTERGKTMIDSMLQDYLS